MIITVALIVSLPGLAFHGGIPSEVGYLTRLRNLNLSHNPILGGEIPVNLSHCSNLHYLDLRYNDLVQGIPSELGFLSKLQILILDHNHLSGRFPPSLGNLSSLQNLSFIYNNLEGEIPNTVAQMKSLTYFRVSENHLSGVFPPSLYNLSLLTRISLTDNNFTGNLNPDLGIALQNLHQRKGRTLQVKLFIRSQGCYSRGPGLYYNISKLEVEFSLTRGE